MRIAAEADGVRSAQATPRARYYDPALVTVHAMKGVKLDRLILRTAGPR
jgi:hypothetical protein